MCLDLLLTRSCWEEIVVVAVVGVVCVVVIVDCSRMLVDFVAALLGCCCINIVLGGVLHPTENPQINGPTNQTGERLFISFICSSWII